MEARHCTEAQVDIDVFDGRGFIKSSMGGPSGEQAKQKSQDVDIDLRLGTVAGFHGETVRGVDLRMSRRGGIIKSFTLNAKLGRDTPLNGDLRGRAGGRNVLYIETADAGSFFRFSDTYPKIFGGEMWVAMDPPTGDSLAPQDGILNIRDFTVRGEPASIGLPPARRRRKERRAIRPMPASSSRACASSSPAPPAASRSARAS